jgi:4-hydroxy-3-polyprenylbenzoate decarboxylase
MMDLKRFIARLRQLKELREVAEPVKPQLELAACCRREYAAGNGQALLFPQVQGSLFPAAGNLFGSERRTAELLHSHSLDDFTRRVESLLAGLKKRNSWAELSELKGQTPVVESGLQHCAELTLADLPGIKSWPGEGGRYLTLALAVSRHPDNGVVNLGLYRAQLLGPDRIALNFSPVSGAAEHLRLAAKKGCSLPICLVLGGDPALWWVAAAPLPKACSEYQFYSTLFQCELPLCSAVSQALPVPATAELVIEGEIWAEDRVLEGPFGNHTGQYVSRDDCPLMRVTAIQAQTDPLIPLTTVGPPPSENVHLAAASERFIRALVRHDHFQVGDLVMPRDTAFHSVALLSVRTQAQGETRELIDSLWREGPLQRARLMILVDEDIDLHQGAGVWWRAVNQLSPERVHSSAGRLAVDASGIDPRNLIQTESG